MASDILNKIDTTYINTRKVSDSRRVEQTSSVFEKYTFSLISNQAAKAEGLKLGEKLSNHLNNPKDLNQSA